jgi:hypothetical protein
MRRSTTRQPHTRARQALQHCYPLCVHAPAASWHAYSRRSARNKSILSLNRLGREAEQGATGARRAHAGNVSAGGRGVRARLQVLLQRGHVLGAEPQQRVGRVHGRGERLVGRQDVHKRLPRAAPASPVNTAARWPWLHAERRPRLHAEHQPLRPDIASSALAGTHGGLTTTQHRCRCAALAPACRPTLLNPVSAAGSARAAPGGRPRRAPTGSCAAASAWP